MTFSIPTEILAIIISGLLSAWTGALVWVVRVLWDLDHRVTRVETTLNLKAERG